MNSAPSLYFSFLFSALACTTVRSQKEKERGKGVLFGSDGSPGVVMHVEQEASPKRERRRLCKERERGEAFALQLFLFPLLFRNGWGWW